MIPWPEPIAQPIIGREPKVCCQRGLAGRKAFSGGRKPTVLAPLIRSVARPERGASAVVEAEVCVIGYVCDCDGGAGALSSDALNPSVGNAPLLLMDAGSRVDRAKKLGCDDDAPAVAVAEDAVAEDCDGAPSPSVPLDIVLGDAA